MPFDLRASNYLGIHSRTFATDSAGKLDVLGHDGHSLGMDGAQVRVFKETDHVGFGCLLKSKHGLALEAKIALVLERDLPHESLKGKLPDQELSL